MSSVLGAPVYPIIRFIFPDQGIILSSIQILHDDIVGGREFGTRAKDFITIGNGDVSMSMSYKDGFSLNGYKTIGAQSVPGDVFINNLKLVPTFPFYSRHNLTTALVLGAPSTTQMFTHPNFTVSTRALNTPVVGVSLIQTDYLNTSNLIVPYTGIYNIASAFNNIVGSAQFVVGYRFTLQSVSGTYGTTVVRLTTNALGANPNMDWTGYLAQNDRLQLTITAPSNQIPSFNPTSNTYYAITLLTRLP